MSIIFQKTIDKALNECYNIIKERGKSPERKKPKGKEEIMKEYNSVEELMNELAESNYNYYGLRNATEHDLEVIETGRTYLDASHDWIDGDDTGEELNGSCAIYVDGEMSAETIENRYNQCLNDYCGETIILIADSRSEWGNDENEIILGSNGCGADVIGYVRL